MPTFWILQNNIQRIQRLTVPVALVLREAGRPLGDFSYVSDVELPGYELAAGQRPFLYGSTAMVNKASQDARYRDTLWFNAERFDQRAWLTQRPDDMLNTEGEVLPLGEVLTRLEQGSRFVRPLADLKAFTGCVLTQDAYPDWRLAQAARNGLLSDQDPVWVSPVQPILAEYRFVVGDHEVLLGSSYQVAGAHVRSTEIPDEVRRAAARLAKGWQPARLCVMDVCMTERGPRIVEFNCVHCSGLYAMAPSDFVEAVEGFHRSL